MNKYILISITFLLILIGCKSIDADNSTTDLNDAKYLGIELGADDENILVEVLGKGESYIDSVYKIYCYTNDFNNIVLFKFYNLDKMGENPNNPLVNQIRIVEHVSNIDKKHETKCKKIKNDLPFFGELKLGMKFDEAMKNFIINGFKYNSHADGSDNVNYFSKEIDIGIEDTPDRYKEYANKGFIKDITYIVKTSEYKVISIAKELSYIRKF